MRFLAGAAVGLLFAVAVVLAVNTVYPGPPTASSIALTPTPTGTMTSSMTTTAASVAYPAVETNTAAYGSVTSTSSTTTTTPAAPASSLTGQGASTAAKTTTATGSIATTLIGTLPPIAIALVLGILVYQLSTRRVDSEGERRKPNGRLHSRHFSG